MQPSDYISIVAIVVSVAAFIASYFTNRKLASEASRHQEAIFHMDRNAVFEGRLADWHDAFALHGVDLDEAKRDGVSAEHIAYLVLSTNALSSVAQMRGHTVGEELKDNNYRRRMFDEVITRRAWKYARRFSRENYRDIDDLLRVKHGETYPEID